MTTDAEYIAFVKNQACISCHTDHEIEPHHYMQAMKGMAMKVSDHFVVPLCHTCHMHLHAFSTLPLYEQTLPHEIAVLETRAHIYRAQVLLLSHWLSVF